MSICDPSTPQCNPKNWWDWQYDPTCTGSDSPFRRNSTGRCMMAEVRREATNPQIVRPRGYGQSDTAVALAPLFGFIFVFGVAGYIFLQAAKSNMPRVVAR